MLIKDKNVNELIKDNEYFMKLFAEQDLSNMVSKGNMGFNKSLNSMSEERFSTPEGKINILLNQFTG